MRQVESFEHGGRVARRDDIVNPTAQQRILDDVECRHAWNNAQKLAYIPNDLASNFKNVTRGGRRQIDETLAMADMDMPGGRLVIAVKHAQERRFTDAGFAMQDHGLALFHCEADSGKNRQGGPALIVHQEGFRKRFGLDHDWHSEPLDRPRPPPRSV